MTGAPDIPGREVDQHVVLGEPDELWFGCYAAALPDGVSWQLNAEWVAEDKDLHSDLDTELRVGQNVDRVEGEG